MRNLNIKPKGKYVKVNRVLEKEQRMDKLMDIVDRDKEITSYQLQKILGFGDGTFYKIGQAVLQAYPKCYSYVKGVWKVIEGFVKIKEPFPITAEWDSKLIAIKA